MRLICTRCGDPATHSTLTTKDSGVRQVCCIDHGRWSVRPLPTIGPSMWSVLGALQILGATPTLQLIEYVWPDRDYGAAAGPINRLIEAGMIERVAAGRRRLLQLTQFGGHIVTWVR